MNGTITVNRGELTGIAFTITDAANGLAGKRVTLSLAAYPYDGTPASLAAIKTKASGLGVSSADVTISTIVAGQITGSINLVPADFDSLPADRYLASLWVDDNAGGDRCVTPNGGGADILVIQPTAKRS